MVRQWQEFFYNRRYVATPLLSPDFVKARRGARLLGLRVTPARRSRARDARAQAAGNGGDRFRVEQEDSVYPMVPATRTCAR